MQTRFPLRNLQRWLHNILSVHQERNVETLDGFRGEKWLVLFWMPHLGHLLELLARHLNQGMGTTSFCVKGGKINSYGINHNSSVMQEDSSWEIKGKGIFSRELMFSLRTPVYVKSGEQLLEEQTLFSQNRFSEYNLGSSGIAGESCQ
ncbi:hypothetical protein MUK42_03082 [Musa troglodytarum]|uniref:Uncharacterized protein n=1 Tax=Musa troglodytarum TaxID=320322 RepID=A0A9E7GY44_9LILI|nr:hypothetical protein MUK42_03082 [Musa troglodytarum]URE21243.1 hypothetical protein MUK42_03082 [Musa troglodytarum]URE21246.1 hypothetical protein MUK42_03082 [Musa troglodytarum]